MDKRTANIPSRQFEQRAIRQYRNYKLVLAICLVAIGLLFLSLSLSYFAHKRSSRQPPLELHPVFMVNTAILVISSIVLELARLYFRRDQWHNYRYALAVFMSLGPLFLIGQAAGAYVLSRSGFGLLHQSSAYLYLLSGFHGLHLLGGLVFFVFLVHRAWDFLKDYATAVVYFTDPVAKRQLDLFALYWHFLGLVWIGLLFFFVIVR